MTILKSTLLTVLKIIGMLLFVLIYPIFALYMRISIHRKNSDNRKYRAEMRRKIKENARQHEARYGKNKSTFRTLFEGLFTQNT